MARAKKTDFCQNCCPEFKAAYHERDVDDDGQPIWTCTNCGHETPRRVTRTGTSLTASQIKAVTWIQQEATRHGYEIKQLRLQMNEYGTLSVVCESGRENDEGTLLSVLGRERRHIFVGRQGGMIAYTCEDGKHRTLTGRKALMHYRH